MKKTKILQGRGSGSPRLPGRRALDRLLKGDPAQRSLGNYAKMTPTGPVGDLGDIYDMGEQPQVVPALPPDE